MSLWDHLTASDSKDPVPCASGPRTVHVRDMLQPGYPVIDIAITGVETVAELRCKLDAADCKHAKAEQSSVIYKMKDIGHPTLADHTMNSHNVGDGAYINLVKLRDVDGLPGGGASRGLVPGTQAELILM